MSRADRLAHVLARPTSSGILVDGVVYRPRTRDLDLQQNCGDWTAPRLECELWDACLGFQSSSG